MPGPIAKQLMLLKLNDSPAFNAVGVAYEVQRDCQSELGGDRYSVKLLLQSGLQTAWPSIQVQKDFAFVGPYDERNALESALAALLEVANKPPLVASSAKEPEEKETAPLF